VCLILASTSSFVCCEIIIQAFISSLARFSDGKHCHLLTLLDKGVEVCRKFMLTGSFFAISVIDRLVRFMRWLSARAIFHGKRSESGSHIRCYSPDKSEGLQVGVSGY
jgi:hypothetical protein